MERSSIICWEALDPADPAFQQARRLYETTLDAAERIPWVWIEPAGGKSKGSRRGGWSPHLLLAADNAEPGRPVIGFAYGLHISDYGGYACYLGVDPRHRRRGAGTQLLRQLVQVLREDAAAEGTPLPFVVWESRAPEAAASPESLALWQARLRLFERVGAWWISGVTFLAPNFARGHKEPVPLQLFLLPVDTRPEDFDTLALRRVAAGLMSCVYGPQKGDLLFDQTMASARHPQLRPVGDLADVWGLPEGSIPQQPPQ
jgi:GNAT superfamily N-acetyltransferase